MSVTRTPSTPACSAAAQKFSSPKRRIGIEVGEDDQAGLGALRCAVRRRGRAHRRGVCRCLTARSLARWMTGPSASGIAEGHAELEHVGAGVNGGESDVARGREVGVAGGEVGDEAGFAGETDRHRIG